MEQRPQHIVTADLTGIDGIPKTLTPSDPAALRRLRTAFEDRQPLAVLIDRGEVRSARVLDVFGTQLENEADVVILEPPINDTMKCMRQIVERLGFETKEFSITDLDNICKMFLTYQKTHRRRTIICLPQAERCSSWVIDKVTELVQLESEQSFGLMVVLAGGAALSERLERDPLASIKALAGRPITINPLTETESRILVRQYYAAAGIENAEDIIDYDAIAHLHVRSGGVADRLFDLCAICYRTARDEDAFPITPDDIDAAESLRSREAEAIQEATENEAPEQPTAAEREEQAGTPLDRLVVRRPGEPAQAVTLCDGTVAIGRDSENDLRLTSPMVSRHHALLMVSKLGVKLMDVGSTNGTFVNGSKIEDQVLEHGDEIRLGDCSIEYLCGDRLGETARAVVARKLEDKLAGDAADSAEATALHRFNGAAEPAPDMAPAARRITRIVQPQAN